MIINISYVGVIFKGIDTLKVRKDNYTINYTIKKYAQNVICR